ncbi:unnamed protein product [Withania somnifera]
MHQRIAQQMLLMLYLLLSYTGVQGEKKLSKLGDGELEKQINFLNKPAVKTVKTKYGDIYDCVDFYKQRAFDHQLLKDHNFHPKMKPTLSRIKKNSSAPSTSKWFSSIWSKDGGCPFGTIPVRRITKDDIIRLRHMPPPEDVTFNTESYVSNNHSEPKGRYISSQGYMVAIARTPTDRHNKFTGGGMTTSLHNPHVEGQQHSACRLKIQRGSNILQVGWRVDPTLYGDTKTRLFIHFQVGKTYCFNTLCPGFVQVNNRIPLDLSFNDTISQPGEEPWEVNMYIEQDVANGNWWLLMTKSFVKVGFWPQKLFTGLQRFATNVEWGGVVYSPPGVPTPPMGSGNFPIENTSHDSYCVRITVSDEKGERKEVYNSITLQTDNPTMYKVVYVPLSHGSERYYFVLYGGPGESAHV